MQSFPNANASLYAQYTGALNIVYSNLLPPDINLPPCTNWNQDILGGQYIILGSLISHMINGASGF